MLLFVEILWCIFETTKIAMRVFLAVFVSLLVGGGAVLAQTVDPSGAGPCGGQSTYNYNGAVYRLAEIGDQCWFADNLRSTSFQNGDPITYANNGGTWTSFGSPRRGVRDNNDALAAQQGYFYNFPAVTDARGLCPSQYRVPTTTDFNNMVAQVIQLYGSNDNALFRAPGTLGNGGFWNGDAFVSGSNLSGLPDSLGAGVPTVGTTTRFTRPRHFGLLPRTPTTTSPFAGCWATTIWHPFLLGSIFCVWWLRALSQGQFLRLHRPWRVQFFANSPNRRRHLSVR